MLWILEGCDGAGKSTLVERFKGFGHEVEVLRRGPLRGSALEEYEDELEEYWPGSGRHIVCDRWHLGELVYGPLLRGESRMSNAEYRHIEKFLLRRGAMLIHVTAPMDVIKARLTERGDDLVTPVQVADIVNAYHDLMPLTTLPAVRLDCTEETSANTLLSLIQQGAYHESVCDRLGTFLTYVGAPDPHVLLLGEKRDDKRRRAAFVPEVGTSDRFLLEHLPLDVARGCGIANALEEDIVSLYEVLGQPMVVALGRDAAAECRRAEIPHGEVPHPQFVYKFRRAAGAMYGSVIREAALFNCQVDADVFRT